MTRDNALAAILKEAQCLGSTRTGLTKVDQPETRSAPRTHAKRPHKAAAPR
jgi:hypothetical protein